MTEQQHERYIQMRFEEALDNTVRYSSGLDHVTALDQAVKYAAILTAIRLGKEKGQ
jgi:hypothetical protein